MVIGLAHLNVFATKPVQEAARNIFQANHLNGTADAHRRHILSKDV